MCFMYWTSQTVHIRSDWPCVHVCVCVWGSVLRCQSQRSTCPVWTQLTSLADPASSLANKSLHAEALAGEQHSVLLNCTDWAGMYRCWCCKTSPPKYIFLVFLLNVTFSFCKILTPYKPTHTTGSDLCLHLKLNVFTDSSGCCGRLIPFFHDKQQGPCVQILNPWISGLKHHQTTQYLVSNTGDQSSGWFRWVLSSTDGKYPDCRCQWAPAQIKHWNLCKCPQYINFLMLYKPA